MEFKLSVVVLSLQMKVPVLYKTVQVSSFVLTFGREEDRVRLHLTHKSESCLFLHVRFNSMRYHKKNMVPHGI
jgi:hypothetical protein